VYQANFKRCRKLSGCSSVAETKNQKYCLVLVLNHDSDYPFFVRPFPKGLHMDPLSSWSGCGSVTLVLRAQHSHFYPSPFYREVFHETNPQTP